MPAMVVMAVEGVLAEPAEYLNDAQLIPTGRLLYIGLSKYYRIALVSCFPNEDEIRFWLDRHDVAHYAEMLPGPGYAAPVEVVRSEQLTALWSRAATIEMLIDSAPSVIAMGLARGLPGLLSVHPRFVRAEYRPDEGDGPRPWIEIEAELEEQDRLRRTNPRLGGGVVE